jgi:hypothetical protein
MAGNATTPARSLNLCPPISKLIEILGTIAPAARSWQMDSELKKPKHKSVESVTISIKPLTAPEMIP